MDSILVVDGVSKSFGSLRAVDDVSLSVEKGEIFGIAGPNGSGKSTLFNIITSIPFPADSGRIVFEGKQIQRMRANRICRSGLARTFQKETSFDTLSTLDNVILGSTYGRGTESSAESRRQASETLEFVGIGADQFERPAAELSVFDKKRLMIASAIVTEPRVLLLDEPASGLTKPEIDETIDLIRRLNERSVTLPRHRACVAALADGLRAAAGAQSRERARHRHARRRHPGPPRGGSLSRVSGAP